MAQLENSKATSKVQLTFLSIFRATGPGTQLQWSPIVGATHIRMAADGQLAIEAASIPFHNRAMDMRAPRQHGLLALFGIRDALDELQHWRSVARNSNAEFAYLQLHVDVGEPCKIAVTRQALREKGASLRFVNVRRSAAGFQKELLQQFAQWVAEEGGDPARDMAHVRQMALRPDLFERALHEDPDLQHVDVLVIPLADRGNPEHIRQVAYVRAGARVVSCTQGCDRFSVQLPSWMQAVSRPAIAS